MALASAIVSDSSVYFKMVFEPLPEKTSARRMSNGPNHAAVDFSKQLKERYNALEHIVSETDCF